MSKTVPGRIDHVVICVHHENLEDSVRRFSELLGAKFEGPFNSEGGLRVYVDFESGLEVYAPLTGDLARPEADPQRRFLAEHGEGIYRLSFGVRDPDQQAEHARSLGHPVAHVAGLPTTWLPGAVAPDWAERFGVWRQAFLAEPVHGVRLSLSRLDERGSD